MHGELIQFQFRTIRAWWSWVVFVSVLTAVTVKRINTRTDIHLAAAVICGRNEKPDKTRDYRELKRPPPVRVPFRRVKSTAAREGRDDERVPRPGGKDRATSKTAYRRGKIGIPNSRRT